jgi:dihydrofolate synthase/folylpolyglutamate synthase
VGLGGRLDATNVILKPRLTVITAIDYDHQHYLGDTLTAISHEKAGIIKRGIPCIVAAQLDEARDEIERAARRADAPLLIANQDWQAFEQQGRLVFQDENGLLDLPLPQLTGRHQIDNAGNAVASVRALQDPRVSDTHIAQGLKSVTWPARMQRLGPGLLRQHVSREAELWLDGGHNPSAGRALAQACSDLNDRVSRPLVLIWGMLNTKDAQAFIGHFAGIAHRVVAITIPDEENALEQASQITPAPRILILGSLYLAGHVLAAHSGEAMSKVSGAGRR